MPKRFTVQEKILIHLTGYARYAEEFECPEDISQSGIADAIGKSRAHTTLELKRLKESDLVSERLSHVKGAKVKKKVYQLTSAGMNHARNLKKAINDLSVNVEIEGDIREMSGEEAVEILKNLSDFNEVGAFETVSGSDDIIRIRKAVEPTSITGSQKSAVDSPSMFGRFFGRDDELAEINRLLDEKILISIVGMPGIGKTTLATKLMQVQTGKFLTAYVKLYDFDTPMSAAQHLARLFKDHGINNLSDYIENSSSPDIREIFWHLREIVAARDVLFIFDDYDLTGGTGFVEELINILRDVGKSRVILLSAMRPGFYSRKDLTMGNTITEFELGGLDDDASLELLDDVGKITDPDMKERIIKTLGGHPLALELARADSDSGSTTELIYEQTIKKHNDSLEFLSVCSVLRTGFDPFSMRLFGFDSAEELVKSAIFSKYGGGRARLHDVVSRAILEHLGELGKKKVHSLAAEFCEESGEEPVETLHHLVSAGLHDNAVRFALDSEDYFLTNQNLDEACRITGSIGAVSESLRDEFNNFKATLFNFAGKWDDALSLSHELVDGNGSDNIQLDSMIRIAKIHGKRGQNDKALEMISKAEMFSERMPKGGKLAVVFQTKGTVLRGMGEYDRARTAFDLALGIALESDDMLYILRCTMESGVLELMTGDLDAAENTLKKALDCSLSSESKIDEGNIRLNLGWLAKKRGDVPLSIDYYKNAAALGRDLGQPRIVGYGLVGLAEDYNLEDRPDDVFEPSKEAIIIFEELGIDAMTAASYSNIGTAFSKIGKDDESVKNFEIGMDTCKNIDSPHTLGQIYFEYGLSRVLLKDFEKAEELLNRAKEIFIRLGSKDELEEVERALCKLPGHCIYTP